MVVAVHRRDQLVARQHAALVDRERREQPQLGRGHHELGAADPDLVAIAIDRHVADRERGPGRGHGLGRGAPQHRRDPRDELARRERLGEVVVGAELEAEHAIGLLAARRQEHDRDPAARARGTALRPSSSGIRMSSTTRSMPTARDALGGGGAVTRELDRVPGAREREPRDLADVGIVVDHEHGGHG